MLRTYLSLVVARLDGEIVRDLVAGHGRSFVWGITKVRLPCKDVMLVLTFAVVRHWKLRILYERHDQVFTIKSLDCIPHTPHSIYT